MRRTVVLALIVPALALGLGACGGSSSDEGGQGPSTSSSSSTTGGGGTTDFAALAAKGRDAEVKVSYRNRDKDGTFTVAQHGGDSYVAFGNDAIYGVGGATITCQGSGSDAQCFALPGPADLATTVVQSFFGAYAGLVDRAGDASRAFGAVTTSTSSERIAGRDAECATVTVQGVDAAATVCLDQETGVLLRIGSGSDTDLITATSFAPATAADVTPPATPQTLGG